MSGICVSVNLKNNHLQDDGHPHFSVSDLKKKRIIHMYIGMSLDLSIIIF